MEIDGHKIISEEDTLATPPWCSWLDDLPGCRAIGETLEDSVDNLRLLFPEYMKARKRIEQTRPKE